jgi:hypothetical protein
MRKTTCPQCPRLSWLWEAFHAPTVQQRSGNVDDENLAPFQEPLARGMKGAVYERQRTQGFVVKRTERRKEG